MFAQVETIVAHQNPNLISVDITTYDLTQVPLLREGRSFKLFVPGLAENRPSVLKGDKILIRVDGDGGKKFEGLVTRTTQEVRDRA